MSDKELMELFVQVTKEYSEGLQEALDAIPKDASLERTAVHITHNIAGGLGAFAQITYHNKFRSAESKYMIPKIYINHRKLIDSQSAVYENLSEAEKKLLGYYNTFVLFSYDQKVYGYEERLKKAIEAEDDEQIFQYTVKCDISRKIFEKIRKIWSIYGIEEIQL